MGRDGRFLFRVGMFEGQGEARERLDQTDRLRGQQCRSDNRSPEKGKLQEGECVVRWEDLSCSKTSGSDCTRRPGRKGRAPRAQASAYPSSTYRTQGMAALPRHERP